MPRSELRTARCYPSADEINTGTGIVMDGGNSLGTLTLTPSGQAAITTSTLAAGIHTFTFCHAALKSRILPLCYQSMSGI
jgi:hypothetical protein